jgi:hypothetical protein
VGINPKVRLSPDSKVRTYIPAGMVTVSLGNNAWAGGSNDTNFAVRAGQPHQPEAPARGELALALRAGGELSCRGNTGGAGMEEALLLAIHEAPGDDTARLVLAD